MLVYLDIDGVMIPDADPSAPIAAPMAARLLRILDQTGAKLIISSHRRRSLHSLRTLLGAASLDDRLWDGCWMTPDRIDPLNDDLSIRGQEIQAHVDDYQVVDFVILDDCPVLAIQAARHIQPNPSVGLTDTHVDQAIAILQSRAVAA